jgi:cell division protein FtsI/penicillin-binding protein 2
MVTLLVVFAVFASVAVARLAYWQIVRAPVLVAEAAVHLTPAEEDLPPRADIVDRNGTVLAQAITFDRLDAYPKDIPEERRAGIVATLADRLGLDAETQESISSKLASETPWTWLLRELTPEQSIDVRLAMDDGLLPGIGLEPLAKRVYPRSGGQPGTSLASHLIGFVAGDGGGAYGVERLYEDRLAGRTAAPAVASIAGSASGATSELLSGEGLTAMAPPPLRLTVDAGLQKAVESLLNNIRIQDKAKSVSAVVMDPYTGAIYAAASVPGFDANDYAEVFRDDPDAVRDRIVSALYEPGSVMKMFTVAAALSKGAVTPTTRIRDQAVLRFGPKKVRNSDRKSIGVRPVKTIIAESRNVGTAKIAQKLGSTQRAARALYDTWRNLGATGRTGVDIAGEEAGLAWDPSRNHWQPVDLATRSFGQGVSTTLLQLATGYAPLMNGGYRIQPHVVVDGDAANKPTERVLKPRVARQTQEILTWVTGSVYRYADGALIPGWMIGGKTGTAQIWDSRRHQYKLKRYNHSFVGFVGSDRPDVLIALRIEEATPISLKPLDLATESYEAFEMVARAAIKHLGIPRSKDPDAGLPIRGTQAARIITPDRARAIKPGQRRGGEDRGAAARDRGRPRTRSDAADGPERTGRVAARRAQASGDTDD